MMLIGARQQRVDKPKNYRLTVNVDEEMNKQLQSCAERHSNSKAEIIRMTLQRFLASGNDGSKGE